MCGLVGMAGFLEHKHKAVMQDLLFLDTLRGKDSTGLTCVSRDKDVLTRKMTVPGYEFIEFPIVENSMTHADQIWMGHNRFKTTGSVSRLNAHPFEVLDDDGLVMLVGTHNGTLENKWELDREGKRGKFDTDSEALFNLLVEKPNFKEAIRIAKGAWSLVFWDPTTDCLHFLRNDQRPMTWAFTDDRKVMIWASEAWMIVNAARRNGVKLDTNDKGLACFSSNPDTLYTLEIPQERNVALPEIKREGGYLGQPSKKFQNWNKAWWGYDDDPDEERTKQAAKGTQKAETNGTKDEQKVITLGIPQDHMRGFGGELLSLKDFATIKTKGCVWCQDKFEQDKPFAFLNEDSLVCMKCLRDEHPHGYFKNEGDWDDGDVLDDPLPFKMQADSQEYKRLIDSAAIGAAKKAVG